MCKNRKAVIGASLSEPHIDGNSKAQGVVLLFCNGIESLLVFGLYPSQCWLVWVLIIITSTVCIK